MFKPVDKDVNVQKVEQEQLEFWRLNRVFQRTTEGREDAPRYVFFEGPPTANGKPGSHHVLARADGRTTVVPVHAGEDVGPGLLRQILRDADLTVDQFCKLL